MYLLIILILIVAIIIIFIAIAYGSAPKASPDADGASVNKSNFPATSTSIPQNMVFVPCKGEYALCYYAKCRLNDNGTAECGCREFKGTSFVDVTQIIPPDVKEETKKECPYGLTSCPKINEAPVCDYVNTNLTSTFSLGEPIFDFSGTQTCPSGKYANCMTAQCTRKEAWDGSPISCVCQVENSKHTIAHGVGPCNLDKDIIWSGVPIT